MQTYPCYKCIEKDQRIAALEAENTEAYNNGYANAALKFADRSAKLEEIMESDWFKYMKEHGNDRG